MRLAISSLFLAFALALPQAVAAPAGQFANSERILGWVYAYRTAPEPTQVPAAVRAMKDLGLFRDPDGEGASLLTGFLAGVLNRNPRSAGSYVARMFPLPPKEQAVVIKAIAYSQLPRWKQLLTRFAKRMPERKAMIDAYLSGKAKTLMDVPLKEGPNVIYTLWGYYLATGSHEPVMRIISALRWTKPKSDGDGLSFRRIKSAVGWGEESDVEKLTIGGTAKWTLVSHAERDRTLLTLYRAQIAQRPEKIALPLKEVLAAAEGFQSERVRKEEHAAIKEEEQRHLRQGTPLSRAGYAGSVALSAACVIAGVTGHVEIAVPCVITGVLYTGATKVLQNAR